VAALVCVGLLVSNHPVFADSGRVPHDLLTARSLPDLPTQRVYFYSVSGNSDGLVSFFHDLVAAGAQHVNCFLPSVVVCDLPLDLSPSALIRDPDIIYAPETSIEGSTSSARALDLEWARHCYAEAEFAGFRDSDDVHLPFNAGSSGDVARVPEEVIERTVAMAGQGAGPVGVLADRHIQGNSEVLAGDILVQVLFPESGPTPGNTEDWRSGDIPSAMSDIALSGLTYQRHYSRYDINFVFEHKIVEIDSEPIKATRINEGGWILQVMNELGQPTVTGHLETVHEFNNAARARRGTDWVFTAFIVNSFRDADHRFANTTTNGWAYLGGPYLVLPRPPGASHTGQGPPIGNFKQHYSHYFGHIFWALDEHGAATDNCSSESGYLKVQNLNKTTGVGPQGGIRGCSGNMPAPCVMNIDNATVSMYEGNPCVHTAAMFGLSDANRNFVADALDQAPTFHFTNTGVDTIRDSTFVVLKFQAVARGVRNKNPQQVSSRRVNYRVPIRLVGRSREGVVFQTLQPLDGGYGNELEEDYEVMISELQAGMNRVTFVSQNVAGAKLEAAKRIYLLSLRFILFQFTSTGDGTRVSWNTWGETFDATLSLHRIDRETGVDEVIASGPDIKQGFANPPFTPFWFIDTTAIPSRKYAYYVEGAFQAEYRGVMEDFNNKSEPVDVVAALPISHGLLSDISPNPFRDRASISVNVPATFSSNDPQTSFPLPVSTEVVASVYDVMGRRIKEIHRGESFSGVLTVAWDGTNANNEFAPSGVYFIRVIAGPQVGAKKVILVR